MKRLLLLAGVALPLIGFSADAIRISGQVALGGQYQMVSGSFSPPSKATSISPADAATHVALAGPVTWANGGGATSYKLYLDTSNPPTTLVQNSTALTYTASLSYNTLYRMRIDPVNSAGTTTGDVTSFTTLDPIMVSGYAGLDVGGSDGDTLTVAKLNTGTQASVGTWAFVPTPATGLITGNLYQISVVGTTDFTTVGAANNNVGTNFTATGTATGTGQCIVPRAFVSGSATSLDTPVKLISDNTIYTGTGFITAIKFGMDQQSNAVKNTFTTPVASYSESGYITIGPIQGTNSPLIDLVNATSALGGFSVMQMAQSGLLHMHTETNGGSQIGADINGTVLGNTYFYTMYHAQHGQPGAVDILKIYTPITRTLIGTSSCDTSGSTTKASNYVFTNLGRVDGHTGGNQPASTSYVTFSQWFTNFTGTYPLGP